MLMLFQGRIFYISLHIHSKFSLLNFLSLKKSIAIMIGSFLPFIYLVFVIFNSKWKFIKLKCSNKLSTLFFDSVQFSSVAQSCMTICDPMNHSTPGLPVHHQLPEFPQTHVHQVSDAIQPLLLSICRPLLLLPPIPPSIRVFSNESTLHMRWPKY